MLRCFKSNVLKTDFMYFVHFLVVLGGRVNPGPRSPLGLEADVALGFAASRLSLYLPSFYTRTNNTVSQQMFCHHFLDSQSGRYVVTGVSLTQYESTFVSPLLRLF